MKSNPRSANDSAGPNSQNAGENEHTLPTLSPQSPLWYTLSPLVKDGRNCLVCRDVEGMEWAALESVEFYYAGSPWQRITRQSEDIFALTEQEIIQWPALENIAAARFRIRLKDEARSRRITIRPSKSGDVHGSTNSVILDWMRKRNFLKTSPDAALSLE